MDLNNAADFLKRGFHVTLGATTAFVEALQNEQKREENLAQLNLDVDELTQIWAQKGEETESEARRFVDDIMAQHSTQDHASSYAPAAGAPTQSLQQQLQELTTQLASIRIEIEQFSDSPDV